MCRGDAINLLRNGQWTMVIICESQSEYVLVFTKPKWTIVQAFYRQKWANLWLIDKKCFLTDFGPGTCPSINISKVPENPSGDVDKKQAFLEPYTAQHGNEAACTACCVAQL